MQNFAKGIRMFDTSILSETLLAQIDWGFSNTKEKVLKEFWQKEYSLFECAKLDKFGLLGHQIDDPGIGSIELAKCWIEKYNIDKKQIFFGSYLHGCNYSYIVGFVVDDCIVYINYWDMQELANKFKIQKIRGN